MRLGTMEILLIVVLALVLFGGKKLAGVGKALGQSIRDFKKEMKAEDKNAETEEKAEENRKIAVVKSAISTLSFSEMEAITHIFDELNGMEGILVASKIADKVGITRSVIVNALRKFESAGVIESRSSGMKGTYIKVLNDVVFDEVEKLKEQGRY